MFHPAEGLQDTHLEMITTGGTLQQVPYSDVKALCIVTAGAKAHLFSESVSFERRPKLAGLWIRFLMRDGDHLEGILSHNLLDWPERGYWITPPKAGPSRQRVFLPRLALSSTEMLGVVGVRQTPKLRFPQKLASLYERQLPMFDD